MKLAELQRAMGGYLVDAPTDNFAETMQHSPGLRVYRNNYRGQLQSCLQEAYEKTWAWLGDADFDAATTAYIDAHPPQGWTLDVYGEDFAAMLRTLHPRDPEVADLATLEWTMRTVFVGPDAAPVDPAQLGEVDWDQVRFTMAPTLVLLDGTTNAPALWSALANDETPPTVEILPGAVTVAVWRQDLSPCFRTLDAAEARLLRLATKGTSFGTMCFMLADAIIADGGDAEAASTIAGAALGQWLRDGLIVGLM